MPLNQSEENIEFKVEEVSPEATSEELDPRQTDELRVERDVLKTERDELKEMLQRRQAEFDNFRKRSERERSEYLQFAGMDTVKDLLPIVDDFERALKVEGGNPEYVKGIEMIYNRTLDTLKKLGLEPLETAGKLFDPHLHQAIERVETEDFADNTVLGEFQRGYFFKGKLLRPAMVRVAVHN